LEHQLFAILIAYLVVEVTGQFLLMLNLKHLSRHGAEVPQGFKAHVDAETLTKMLVFSQVVALAGFYAAYRLTAGDFFAELFKLDIPSMHAKLLLVTFIGSLVLFLLKPLMAYLSRRHEIEADTFALQLTQMPVSMANGLIKLGKDNLANLHPHPWYAAVYYSHPPLAQRVKRILSERENGEE